MNLSSENYLEEKDDVFYDWILNLKISKDLFWEYKTEIDNSFSSEFLYSSDENNSSALIRTKSVSITNSSPGSCCIQNTAILAIKVNNGYLVTDPIAFSI